MRLLHLRHPEHLNGAATASAATAPCTGYKATEILITNSGNNNTAAPAN
jgi:hypothetical protein